MGGELPHPDHTGLCRKEDREGGLGLAIRTAHTPYPEGQSVSQLVRLP